MSDNNNPNVDDIKDRLKVEIPIEEEPEVLKVEVEPEADDMIGELSNLGRQFAETLKTAWNSEERAKFENEMREGVNMFVQEVDKVVRDIRDGSAGEKIRTEAAGVKEQVDSGDLSKKARSSFVQGLRWLSDEVGKLADQFSPVEETEPVEKSPEDL